ncbi:hypothetical protein [Corynebacterium stationis]|uniref:hypothetical protein n=1 Tax=Corynebacterium stationis TaxID=1705 RepID=UPI002430C3B0|nr:hypothetical protein [Corynebacterium stationis]
MTNPRNEPEKPEANNPWASKESNPWSQPDDAEAPTAGWDHVSYGSEQFYEDTDSLGGAESPQAQFPVGKKNLLGGFLIGIIIVLALAIIGAVAWLYLSGRIGTDEQGSPGGNDEAAVQSAEPVNEESASAVLGIPESTSAAAAPSEETSGEEPETTLEEENSDSESSGPARSVGRRPAAEPATPVLPEAARAAGLTSSGWSDNAATRCDSTQNLVYAGRDSDAWITVCESDGQMTYKSDIFGGTLTATVDQSRSNPARGEFYVDASPSIIQVVGGGVEVFQGGTLVAEKNFPSAWVID